MFGTPSTNSPVAYRTNQNYSQTFTGPIKRDPNLAQSARNESMAKAAYAGDVRGYYGQTGRGVQAGSKMANYRAGLQADSEAAKGYAQAQQDLMNRYAQDASAELLFQERQAGEQGWLRDLLLDRDDVRTQERKAAFKRKADVEMNEYQIRVDDAVARDRREAEIWSSLL